jgi:transcriptional regulator with XRE-family HTH domain
MVNTVEIHVGSRLRRTREFRGMEQRDLARTLGLGVDGLDRLERGAARLAGPVLFAAGRALCVDPSFFFKGLKGFAGSRPVALDGVEPRASYFNDNGAWIHEPRRRLRLVSVSDEARLEFDAPVD